MTLAHLFAVLRARWLVTLGTLVLVVGGITTAILLWPKSYTATAAVVVDIKSPDPIAGMVLAGVTAPSYLMTQTDILASNRVALKVVKALHLENSPEMRAKWKDQSDGVGSFEAWMADLLSRYLDVRPSRGSNVITVAYTSQDPNFACLGA